MPTNSFERFYYQKVALGEGCGCAEQIIATRNLDAPLPGSEMASASQGDPGEHAAWLGRLLRRWRLGRQPR